METEVETVMIIRKGKDSLVGRHEYICLLRPLASAWNQQRTLTLGPFTCFH